MADHDIEVPFAPSLHGLALVRLGASGRLAQANAYLLSERKRSVAVAATEIVLTGFLLVLVASELLSVKSKLPYTLVLVFVGIGVTTFASLPTLGSNAVTTGIVEAVTQMRSVYSTLVKGGLFVGLVVPPLIFEAMMHVDVENLKSVVRPALVLATVGVAVATLVCGAILWRLAGLSLMASMLFAVIISPTDTVTVLEVFRRAKVPLKLSTLMEVEAAFNDATAIVIFSILLSSVGVAGISLFSSFTLFVFTMAGGAVIGLLVALWARRIISAVEDRTAKTIVTVSAVYGSYVFASGLGMSGLIAVAIVGLYIGNVTRGSTIASPGREAISTFWELAAFLGNSVAFLMIGFETNLGAIYVALVPILAAYLAVTVARTASAYPILAIFSQVGEKIPISWSNVAVLGGFRGALSIALAASLGVSAVVSQGDVQTITTMVLGVAFLSITIQAPLLARYIRGRFGKDAIIGTT